MSYGSDWVCECGWGNLDVRRKCRHCGKAKPECPPALPVTETADEGVVAWRAVAHPETGMGAMIHPIKRFLVQDADGIYGEGRWELQALVVRSSAADTNVSEAHMFGPPVDPVHPPAEARALAAEAKCDALREALAKLTSECVAEFTVDGKWSDDGQLVKRRTVERARALTQEANDE